MQNIYVNLTNNDIDENKICPLKDGGQSNNSAENIIYSNKNKIEDYRDDWEKLLVETRGLLRDATEEEASDLLLKDDKSIISMAKNLGTIRLDFMEKENNTLFNELEEKIN